MGRRSMRALTGAVVFFAILAGYLIVLLQPRTPRPPGPAEHGKSASGVVSHVYDGDTLDVDGVGKVRLLGIDALDGHSAEKMLSQSRSYGLTTRQVEHWAGEATALAVERLEGRQVVLHFGPERRDDYGRALAYVGTSDGEGEQDFGLLMLQRGLAATYRRATHPRKDEYLAAERLAQKERRGIWQDARVKP